MKKAAPLKPPKPVKLTEFTRKQRQRLLDLRDDLVDAMSGVAGEIRNAADGSNASVGGMHQGDAGLFSIADAFYWLVVGSVLAARYVDVRYLNGMTADGHPSSWGHWRRYAVLFLAGCTTVWLVLHAAAGLY